MQTSAMDATNLKARTGSDASSASEASSMTTVSDITMSTTASNPASGAGSEPVKPASSPEDQARADALKEDANRLFSAGKYTLAVTTYSEALEIVPSAVLYANRAAAQLKCENYGSAIQDAEAALRLDSSYVKANYRRGSAYLALARYKDAKKDFAYVVKVKPTDADAKAKLSECDKAIKRAAFEEAIALEHTRPLYETINVATLSVPADYKGPVLPHVPGQNPDSNAAQVPRFGADGAQLEQQLPPGAASAQQCAQDERAVNQYGISLGFVKQLMAEFKAQRGLHKKYCWELLLRLRSLLASYPSLVHVPYPTGAQYFNVCGDTHGQYYDTCNLFDLAGLPSPTNPFVFNGDFVDRGSFSVENVLTLFAWKLLFPDYVHLTRGNHETKNMNKMYGFEGEVKAKFDQTTMDLFAEVFQALPVAVCVDTRALVVHGGLFQQDGVSLEDIAKIDRFREPPTEGLMSDVLWSDPQPFPGRGPSKRGVGQSFGPDVTARFLAHNGLEVLIRSHEVKEEGYVVEHGGKCITVFSAPNYCDQMGNKAAVCRLGPDRGTPPTFLQFSSVPHPPVKPMAYSSMSSMFGL